MKYLIVGAVAGGASTAARLRRMDESATIVMFEKGAYVSYANCGLPYYIGDVIKDRNKLFVQTAAGFKDRFNIDVRTNTEVLSIDKESKTVKARNLLTGEEYVASYDKLVLSPGAEPVRPPLSGIDLPGIFTLRNVPDTDSIKESAKKYANGGKAVVIGAGFIGLEMAENLHELGISVSIVEMANQILAPVDYPIAAVAQQHIRSKGVKLMLNTAVSGFEKIGARIKINFKDGKWEEADMVILSIGVKPDTKLAVDAGLKIGEARGIWVNEYLQTSDPDIYAVGDAIEFANPITGKSMNTYLAGPANKQGRICADNIVLGNKHSYKGAINTAIVKVFDYTVAASGMASKHLKANDIQHIVSTTRSASHATYYPGSHQLTMQIAFSPDDGKLLGAQVIGVEGVDKRMDTLALLIQKGGTIYDLTEMEHAFAPPFSSAKDPVNMAGFVAENVMNGLLNILYWDEFENKYKVDENGLLIDVRTVKEHARGSIEGAINIPVDELRSRLETIPSGKTLYVFCEIGLRGYVAQRILKQSGYANVYNLSGGYALWNIANTEKKLLEENTKS
jgi:NADPH-dependent 2,4-dienoyl-CoA reductase/sulfur reductase-like enzyme/rhodanese-related sulfurtransferase